MTELSSIGKITQALELAKEAQVGCTLTYFDVIEMLGHVKELEYTDTELQEENERLRRALDAAIDAVVEVVSCCTYGSEEDAKAGAYGISHKAFTKIDSFIRQYALDDDVLKGGEG